MPGEMGFDTGPYVNAALFCERALQERDGILSVIRVMDQVVVAQMGPEASPEMPPNTVVQTTFVAILKPGEARGTYPLRLDLEGPDAVVRQGPQISVSFTGGPHNGVNVMMPIAITVTSEGLHWANLWLNDRIITRVPLMISYQFVRGPGGLGMPPPELPG